MEDSEEARLNSMEVGKKVRLKLEHYGTWLPLHGIIVRMEDGIVWMKEPRMDGSSVFSQSKFEEYYEVEQNTEAQNESGTRNL